MAHLNFFMRLKGAILLLLIFFRVIIIPIWFCSNASGITNKAKVFEQIRQHKRRSSYSDEMASGDQVGFVSECCNLAQSENELQVTIICPQKSYSRPIIFLLYNYRRFLYSYQYLFLKNRILRI